MDLLLLLLLLLLFQVDGYNYVINRRGIVQQRSSFGSIFLLFPMKVAMAHASSSQGKSRAPSF